MPKHATRTSFRPGQSGNPGGKPKAGSTPAKQIAELREVARNATKRGIQRAVWLAENAAKEETQLRAIQFLAEFGCGRSPHAPPEPEQAAEVVDLAQFFPVRIDTSTDGKSSTETAQTAPEASSEGQGGAETAETVR